MSVIVMVRFAVKDVAKAVDAQHDFLQNLTKPALEAGMHHHQLVMGDGELVMISQWETKEQFLGFYDGRQHDETVFQNIGMIGSASASFYELAHSFGTI